MLVAESIETEHSSAQVTGDTRRAAAFGPTGKAAADQALLVPI
jgi:hypothetical protein